MKKNIIKVFVLVGFIIFAVYSLWFTVDLGEYYWNGVFGIIPAIVVLALLSGFISALFFDKFDLSVLVFPLIGFCVSVFYGAEITTYHECVFSSEFTGLCVLGNSFVIFFVCSAAVFLGFLSFSLWLKLLVKVENKKLLFLRFCLLLVILIIGLIYGARPHLSIKIHTNDDTIKINTNNHKDGHSITISNNSIFPYYLGLFDNDTKIRIDNSSIFCKDKNLSNHAPYKIIDIEKGFIMPFTSVDIGLVEFSPDTMSFTAGWMEDTCHSIQSFAAGDVEVEL